MKSALKLPYVLFFFLLKCPMPPHLTYNELSINSYRCTRTRWNPYWSAIDNLYAHIKTHPEIGIRVPLYNLIVPRVQIYRVSSGLNFFLANTWTKSQIFEPLWNFLSQKYFKCLGTKMHLNINHLLSPNMSMLP